MDFAFYGRVSTEDQQGPQASRAWRLSHAATLIAATGGRITHEFFDIGSSRSLPWKRRPEAALLLAALKAPDRGFQAVVIGEPERAFYGHQYGLTFPLFVHYGVQLWVPEVGGPIDPDSEAHDLVMSVFGGMSKGERTRIRVRVRAAMNSQTVMGPTTSNTPARYTYARTRLCRSWTGGWPPRLTPLASKTRSTS
ncbi:recombinase family protein [Actinoplanes aureus]|uniref:Recombinase family protein n=1 Tax=Actinoplanes aureus TaxID=2792083 RepID=A0A931CEZ1_9ACTN|nr:recombinase family protein [Actinoplanes aureus]MBG0567349.1 recombinase family protein [Actinoplanes aureus]